MLAAFVLQKFLANVSFLIGETRVALFTDESKSFSRFCVWMMCHCFSHQSKNNKCTCFHILTEWAAADIPISLSAV